jgi:thiol-disulfide isomerase/thioredoxin
MQKNLMSIAILGLSATGLATVMGVMNPPAAVQSILSPKSDIQSVQAMAMGGGRLAKELQGKPVVVDIYATWCPGCQSIKPTLSTLKKEYSGKVNFVVFDVTDRKTSAASQAKAQKLGLSEFFAANKSKTSTVAIINPATGDILKVYQANPNLADYKAVLNPAIASIR